MSVTVKFACGHEVVLDHGGDQAPVCPICHEHRVSRVTAPQPVFRGFCTGPLVKEGN